MKYFYQALAPIILLLSGWSPQVCAATTVAPPLTSPPAQPVAQDALMTKDVSLLRPEFGTVFAPHMQTIATQVTAISRSDRLGIGARVEQGNAGIFCFLPMTQAQSAPVSHRAFSAAG